MARYTIMGKSFVSGKEVVISTVDSHPEAIVAFAKNKTFRDRKGDNVFEMKMYSKVWFVDHAQKSFPHI